MQTLTRFAATLGSKVGSNQKAIFSPKKGVKLRQINESVDGS